MARRTAPLQINGFEGGFNTEFNPLQIPPNVSVDEVNMELRRDKSRSKRLGMNYEPDYVEVNSGVVIDVSQKAATQIFLWENAGGDPDKSLMVVQAASSVQVFDPDAGSSISAGLLLNYSLPASSYSVPASFTVIGGDLIMVIGQYETYIFEFDGESTVTVDDSTELKVRDFWGCQADPYTNPESINKRDPGPQVEYEYLYNLRNQTFGLPRRKNNTENDEDPIEAFFDEEGAIPSHADNVNNHLYADPDDSDDRITRRFFTSSMKSNPGGSVRAPMGHCIIDVFKRGESRYQFMLDKEDEFDDLENYFSSAGSNPLPQDKSSGGASVCQTFAGRVWFAGFPSGVTDGDSFSPSLSSYVLFSTLVNSKKDIGRCYQEADPTSPDDAALVATDGGFIKIEDAFNIVALKPVSNSLMVFAENGVWRVAGNEDGGFTSTSYAVEKVSDRGCVSGQSVVMVGKSLFYWSFDGIYIIAPNEYGVWGSQNLSISTIQTFYVEMDFNKKATAKGFYDSYENQVRWVYTGQPIDESVSEELILNLNFRSFTKNSVPTIETASDEVYGSYPLVVAIGRTEPYDISQDTYPVTVNTADVTASGVDVEVTVDTRQSGFREIIYLIDTGVSAMAEIKYTFGRYYDESFYDWGTEEIAYDAYIITGAITGGEARYNKQAPYLTAFFKKTEDGFNPDLSPTNESSCLISSRWNWTENLNGRKWSTPRQAYRNTRLYFPTDSSDTFDSGDTVITTKNKIRGIGHSVAFKFDSEAGKNMHIHGWAFNLQANEVE